jgi:hypothetical protein
MNIFYLHNDPQTCAEMHNDKHVVKMILEYAQLLSTAHRVIDGTESIGLSKSGRKQKRYVLSDDRDSVLYSATHLNHPSAKWTRHCEQNYRWLFNMWTRLLEEYTYRYGKHHSAERLLTYLARPPKNIDMHEPYTAPWRAMPDEYKADRSVPHYTIESYRAYYLGAKVKMSRWTNREMPTWFADGINTLYDDACYIERKPKLNRIISMPLQYANL